MGVNILAAGCLVFDPRPGKGGDVMKKALFITIASLFLLSFTFGLALAAEENAAFGSDAEFISRGLVTADENGDVMTIVRLQFNSHYTAFAIKVDWDRTLATFYCRVRDLQGYGDSWVAAFGRRSGARIVSTTNQTAGGVPFNVGIWSDYRSVYGKNTTIWVTPGKVTAGFPAQMDVELNLPARSWLQYRVFRYN